MQNYYIKTNDYGLNETGNNYAKLFDVKTSLYNEDKYNHIQIIFELIHFTSNNSKAMFKKYALSCKKSNGNNVINFIDLDSNKFTNVECKYNITNDSVNVFVKGSLIGADIKLKILYASNLGYFNFYNLANFNETPINLIQATPNDSITVKKDTFSNDTINVEFRNDKPYTLIGTFKPYNASDFNFLMNFIVSEQISGTSTGYNAMYYLAFNSNKHHGNITNMSNTNCTKKLKLSVSLDNGIYYIYLTPIGDNLLGDNGYGHVTIRILSYNFNSSGQFNFENSSLLTTENGTEQFTIS